MRYLKFDPTKFKDKIDVFIIAKRYYEKELLYLKKLKNRQTWEKK